MNRIDKLIEILNNIYLLLREHTNSQAFHNLPPEEVLTRQEVKDYLCISESTYKRKVKEGILQPIKMPGGDRFTKAALLHAFMQSKQRGRL